MIEGFVDPMVEPFQNAEKFDDVFELGEICDIFDSGLDYSRKKLGDAVFYDADKAKS